MRRADHCVTSGSAPDGGTHLLASGHRVTGVALRAHRDLGPPRDGDVPPAGSRPARGADRRSPTWVVRPSGTGEGRARARPRIGSSRPEPPPAGGCARLSGTPADRPDPRGRRSGAPPAGPGIGRVHAGTSPWWCGWPRWIGRIDDWLRRRTLATPGERPGAHATTPWCAPLHADDPCRFLSLRWAAIAPGELDGWAGSRPTCRPFRRYRLPVRWRGTLPGRFPTRSSDHSAANVIANSNVAGRRLPGRCRRGSGSGLAARWATTTAGRSPLPWRRVPCRAARGDRRRVRLSDRRPIPAVQCRRVPDAPPGPLTPITLDVQVGDAGGAARHRRVKLAAGRPGCRAGARATAIFGHRVHTGSRARRVRNPRAATAQRVLRTARGYPDR